MRVFPLISLLLLLVRHGANFAVAFLVTTPLSTFHVSKRFYPAHDRDHDYKFSTFYRLNDKTRSQLRSLSSSSLLPLYPFPSTVVSSVCTPRTQTSIMIHMTTHDNDTLDADSTEDNDGTQHIGEPSSSSEDLEFDSLDVMLAKARKRGMLLLPYYKLIALLSRPVLKLTLPFPSPSSNQRIDTDVNQRPSFITVGDTIFMTLAIYLGSIGFSVGYFVGKLTANAVRSVESLPVGLAELWTVILAIGFDTVYVNYF